MHEATKKLKRGAHKTFFKRKKKREVGKRKGSKKTVGKRKVKKGRAKK